MSSEKFLRVYKKFDFHAIKSQILIYGAISGSCGNCKAIDLKLDKLQCPNCLTHFHYPSFLNVNDHMLKLLRLNDERPDITFIDYEDFKKVEGALKAEEFLK